MTSPICPPLLHRSSPLDWLVSPLPWGAAGALSLWQVHLHAQALDPFGGVICGRAGLEHCGWCYAAIGFMSLAAAQAARLGLKPLAFQALPSKSPAT